MVNLSSLESAEKSFYNGNRKSKLHLHASESEFTTPVIGLIGLSVADLELRPNNLDAGLTHFYRTSNARCAYTTHA